MRVICLDVGERRIGVAVTDAALHEKTADFDFFEYEADETKPVN